MDRDFGSKPGSGGAMSQQNEQVERRERLRKLALETVDLAKDPYFMKNHLGTFECKLCLTLHNNEGNYLAHTQGKRHQQNLGRRAAREERDAPAEVVQTRNRIEPRKTIKIGRPGYKVVKQMDAESKQRSLLFQIDHRHYRSSTWCPCTAIVCLRFGPAAHTDKGQCTRPGTGGSSLRTAASKFVDLDQGCR